MGKKKQDLSILPDNRPALKGDQCLNCGTPLEKKENFCHFCGQRNDQRRLSFWDVISESFKSYFSVDNRAIHSLIPLLTKPGKLTREFIDGKRQQYVHPIRIYLTVSIVYFTLVSLSNFVGRPELGLVKINDGNRNTSIKFDSTGQNFIIENEVAESDENDVTAPIEINLNTADKKNSNSEAAYTVDTNAIVDTSGSLANSGSNNVQDTVMELVEEELQGISKWDTIPNDGPYLRPKAYYTEKEEPLSRINRFINDHDSVEVTVGLEYLELENTRWNRFLYLEIQKGRTLEWERFLNYFVGKLPIIIFIFLPIFALSFWLVYFRRDYYYIEHLIFLFHVQTVFFILLTLKWLINFSWPSAELAALVVLIFIIYALLAMKRFYRQGWGKTVLKFVLVNWGFLTLGSIFFIIAFGIVFLAY